MATVVAVADVQKARGVEQDCGGGFEGGDGGGGQVGRRCRASSDDNAVRDGSHSSIRRVISQGGSIGKGMGGAPRRRFRFLQPPLPASPSATDDGGGSHDCESSHRQHDCCPRSCTSEGKGRIHVPFPPRRRRRRMGSSKSFRARLSSLLLGSRGCSLNGSGAGAAEARIAAAMAMAVAGALLFLLLLALSARRDLTRPSRAPFAAATVKGRSSGGCSNSNNYVPLFRPSSSMAQLGDRSPRYTQIRHAIDGQLPLNDGRTRARVRELSDPRRVPRQSYLLPVEEEEDSADGAQLPSDASQVQPSYRDVRNCPATPPDGYPFEWSLVDILDRWNIDDVAHVPSRIYQSLCFFDYSKDMDKILAYRDAEAPFVVENDPGVMRTAERWNVPGYLDALLDGSDARRSCEQSRSNHFLFYRPPEKSGPEDAENTTKTTAKVPASRIAEAVPDGMTYREWRERAGAMEEKVVVGGNSQGNQPHYTLRLNAYGANPMRQMLLRRKQLQGGIGDKSRVLHEPLAEYLFDELPFFRPTQDDGDHDEGASLYLVNETAQHGIYCRFGMAGTVADSHFDLGRNAVAVLRGNRRYIVSRPEQCRNLALFPKVHPSGRHSKVDWSDPHRELNKYPEFQRAKGSEVVVSAGQVLWLPSLYFHTIVSLDTTVQCNTRSGDPPSALETFRQCGF